MKRNKIGIMCLSALSVFALASNLSSCDGDKSASSESVSSSENETSMDSSSNEVISSSSNNDGGWSDEAKSLMMTYCGEVLPYPASMFVGTVTVQEIYDTSYDYTYLQIFDTASSFTLKNYYEDLENASWNVIKTYGGDVIQSDSSGTPYAEITKASNDKTVGYDIFYFFTTENSDEKGNTFSSNVIRCYNDLCATRNNATSWSESETNTIKSLITTELPYISLGSAYSISKYSANILQIIDTYVGDLSKEYSDLLVKDGFKLDTINSKFGGSYILNKTLEDGSSLAVTIYYYNGNNFYFSYTPVETSFTSWPEEVTDAIKEKTGISVPEFEIDDGGKYIVYKKNDSYHIYTLNLSETFNYETYTYNVLDYPALTWDEKLSFETFNILDDSYETIGFELVINLTSPTSIFSSSWPTSAIAETLSSTLNIEGISLPILPDSSIYTSGYQLKYEVYGQDYYESQYEYYYSDIKEYPPFYDLPEDASDEEIKAEAARLAHLEMGFKISIFDNNFATYNAYEKVLSDAGWYSYYDQYGNTVYEDKDGKVGVTFSGYSDPSYDNEGITYIFIHPGTEVQHSPSFYFSEDEVNVSIGENTTLELVKSMLPYDVTYSCDDTTGKISVSQEGVVSVASDTAENTTATISATLTDGDGKVYTATCLVTAKKIISYTASSTISAVSDLLSAKGYTASIAEDGESLTVNFGTSISEADLKTLVVENFIPEGFTPLGDSEPSWIEAQINMGNDKYIDGWMCNYQIFNEACYVMIDLFVYTQDGNVTLKVNAF